MMNLYFFFLLLLVLFTSQCVLGESKEANKLGDRSDSRMHFVKEVKAEATPIDVTYYETTNCGGVYDDKDVFNNGECKIVEHGYYNSAKIVIETDNTYYAGEYTSEECSGSSITTGPHQRGACLEIASGGSMIVDWEVSSSGDVSSANIQGKVTLTAFALILLFVANFFFF
ncbi:hypothetical protein M0812_30278 [Anaeramoeba flamelloides]|uniref:Uncharacterized protein n=1 Tax=Anaeramoeba flamelloides TaxID=1746091 RepID=A0AAV7Y8A1_9EUKA|nr:hypothetical protein M0812_30278 [Anaeramoeba flamelloides]|eukprot:Anaeramoba_flamelloidesa89521_778.p1 GENE.a89521_778~~a89521_778.p1  ORF type:complete len:171 (+),score=13.30 a89521_778:43-555(+)